MNENREKRQLSPQKKKNTRSNRAKLDDSTAESATAEGVSDQQGEEVLSSATATSKRKRQDGDEGAEKAEESTPINTCIHTHIPCCITN